MTTVSTSKTRRRLVLLLGVVLLINACAYKANLSRDADFAPIIGQTQKTLRVSYIYFDSDEIGTLWDHTKKYYEQGLGSKFTAIEIPPSAICETGSEVVVEKVVWKRLFDNPDNVRAFGRINCAGREYRFQYLWGLWEWLNEAPWESEVFDPKNKRARGANGT